MLSLKNKLNNSRKYLDLNKSLNKNYVSNEKKLSKPKNKEQATKTNNKIRFNELNVQMINDEMRSKLFNGKRNKEDPILIKKAIEHLANFNLPSKNVQTLKDVTNLEIPSLKGANLEEHFSKIGRDQLEVYIKDIVSFANQKLPEVPKKFEYKEGWTRYDSKTNETSKVSYPADNIMVFDVETLVLNKNCPVMATAVSPDAWYI
jgi:DNA polymerase gamma 1